MNTQYAARLARHRDELDWLFMELYDDRDALNRFYAMLEEADASRPQDLRALDAEREQHPDWFREGRMYGMTMYSDLFAGGLCGLMEKLPYLTGQGITYLHLMSLLKMPHPHNDGGYAVEDFDTVDPAIGTNEQLSELTRLLRGNGVSLCLDFVMNHTADTHRWAMRAKAGDARYQRYYHCFDTREIPDQYERTMPEVFPGTAPGNFTWSEEMRKWVLTTFHT